MDSQATHRVTCPCCKGKKRVPVVEHDEEVGRTILTHPPCNHCQGRGWVPSEVPEEIADGTGRTASEQPNAPGRPLGVMGQIVPPGEGLDTENGHG